MQPSTPNYQTGFTIRNNRYRNSIQVMKQRKIFSFIKDIADNKKWIPIRVKKNKGISLHNFRNFGNQKN